MDQEDNESVSELHNPHSSRRCEHSIETNSRSVCLPDGIFYNYINHDDTSQTLWKRSEWIWRHRCRHTPSAVVRRGDLHSRERGWSRRKLKVTLACVGALLKCAAFLWMMEEMRLVRKKKWKVLSAAADTKINRGSIESNHSRAD